MGPLRDSERIGRVRFIVGSLMAVVNGRRAVGLSVVHSGTVGAVNRDLVVVGSQSMSMRVGVREESSLQHFIE